MDGSATFDAEGDARPSDNMLIMESVNVWRVKVREILGVGCGGGEIRNSNIAFVRGDGILNCN